MPCVAEAMVSDSGMPHTSQARRNAVAADAIAARQGAMRSTARRMARSNGGSDATSAERRTLPPTGL